MTFSGLGLSVAFALRLLLKFIELTQGGADIDPLLDNFTVLASCLEGCKNLLQIFIGE